ncbi:uncharacterized protein [Littorina saxatilis]|uniref:Uncharacterized protein n=1 Tax=Littorina saxatilis TaxID=31220 RepID=A0AAN9B807_9CAEN
MAVPWVPDGAVVSVLLIFVASTGAQSQNCESCPVSPNQATMEGGNITCTFASSLCFYQQGCVSAGAPEWIQQAGWLEASGTGDDYTSYSTLLSPRIHVQRASCLRFYYAQTLPSKLSAISNGSCIFNARDAQQQEMALGEADIIPGNVTIEFRAQNLAKGETWVRLKNVSLQMGTCAKTDPVMGPGGSQREEQQLIRVVCLVVLAMWLSLM